MYQQPTVVGLGPAVGDGSQVRSSPELSPGKTGNIKDRVHEAERKLRQVSTISMKVTSANLGRSASQLSEQNRGPISMSVPPQVSSQNTCSPEILKLANQQDQLAKQAGLSHRKASAVAHVTSITMSPIHQAQIIIEPPIRMQAPRGSSPLGCSVPPIAERHRATCHGHQGAGNSFLGRLQSNPTYLDQQRTLKNNTGNIAAHLAGYGTVGSPKGGGQKTQNIFSQDSLTPDGARDLTSLEGARSRSKT